MRKLVFSLLASLLTVSFAFAEARPVGNKMKQDAEIQEKAVDPGPEFPFVVGDTIVVSRTQTHYLTGEKISSWVYYVMHTVRQVGGTRFPNGVLISGINSWVAADDGQLLLMSPVERADSVANAAAEERTQHDQSIFNALPEADSIVHSVHDTIAAVQDYMPALSEDTVAASAYMPEESPSSECLCSPLHRFSIGLRGGVASLMQETQADVMQGWHAGYDALLDLQYAYYFSTRKQSSCQLGLITGVSLGYSSSPISGGVDTAYTVTDCDGTSIDYTIAVGNVNEHDAQLQLEVPLLFSLRHTSGLFVNVGPRLMVPVYAHYRQRLSDDALIDACFTEYGVNVSNQVVTGRLQEAQYKSKGRWSHSRFNLMLTCELGYEWQLSRGDAIGLGAYANYSVYDMYANDPAGRSLVEVSLPQAGGADVDVYSATDTYGTGLGYFDCGVKLIYHFCFPSKK